MIVLRKLAKGLVFSIVLYLVIAALAIVLENRKKSEETSLSLDKFAPEWNFRSTSILPLKTGKPIKKLLDQTKISDVFGMNALYILRSGGISNKINSVYDFFSGTSFEVLLEKPSEIVFKRNISPNTNAYISFYIIGNRPDSQEIGTETRVISNNSIEKAKFSLYWIFIMPPGSFLRNQMLKAISNS